MASCRASLPSGGSTSRLSVGAKPRGITNAGRCRETGRRHTLGNYLHCWRRWSGTSSSRNSWYCNASNSTRRFQNEPLALWHRLGRYNWLHGAGSRARHRHAKSMGGRADADQHQPPIAANRHSPRHPQRLPSAINIAVNGNAASEQRYSLSLIRQRTGAARTEPGPLLTVARYAGSVMKALYDARMGDLGPSDLV